MKIIYLPCSKICVSSHSKTNHGFEPRAENYLANHIHYPVREAGVNEYGCHQPPNLIFINDFVGISFKFSDELTIAA